MPGLDVCKAVVLVISEAAFAFECCGMDVESCNLWQFEFGYGLALPCLCLYAFPAALAREVLSNKTSSPDVQIVSVLSALV